MNGGPDSPSPSKKPGKPARLSLYGMPPEEAMRRALHTPPPAKPQAKKTKPKKG